MSRDLSGFLGFLAATLALGLLMAVFGRGVLTSMGGADSAIIMRLKKLERSGVEHHLAWAELRGPEIRFQRISVSLDADGQGATVSSTLDFTGELRRPGLWHTRVSSLGLERARYRLRDGEWEAEHTDFPRLLAILEALERRRSAQEQGGYESDGGGPPPKMSERRYRSLGWYIRGEREGVQVSEDYQLLGNTLARPIDEKGTRRIALEEGSLGSFGFPDGLL